ncbi:MAG: hypothetical protein AMS24_04650 [Chlamydiae bacterium SM23_39]|nr:MAG: hypothetical protein AMS24_04650 [Chlamydiae bacterium SM23_39]
MSILITNLNFYYNDTLILENVNLSIKKGDLIIFFGPNGGGKTTLFKLILKLLKPTKGIIKTDNASIGYVPQKWFFDKDFPITTYEFILLGSLYKTSFFEIFPKKIKSNVDFLLENLNLKNLKNKPLGSLSEGEIQKAQFAKALSSDPEILILDEPTSHMDPKSEKALFDQIIKYKQKKTILLTTHNLKTASRLSDKLVLVDKQVIEKLPSEICEHFSLGLYHKPLIKKHE